MGSLEGGDPAAPSGTATLLTSSQSPIHLRPLPTNVVRPWASGVTNFRDVTGGVYKARERIHRSVADLRLLATPPSWGRVADPIRTETGFKGIRPTSRYRNPLYQPLACVKPKT